MIINPANVDAYVAKKGLTPRVSDTQWQAILQRITALFGHDLWHRCRLIHQVDETFGRYSTVFPDSVPQPYRHIRYLELLLCDSPQLQDLENWLTSCGVSWRECIQRDTDTEQDAVVGLHIFGYGDDVVEQAAAVDPQAQRAVEHSPSSSLIPRSASGRPPDNC